MRELTQHECLALLARNHVARLAFLRDGRPDVEPLHYVYAAGWLYGRTAEGAKLDALAHCHWVALEASEVRRALDWTSVVVRGSFHRLDGVPAEAAAARAVEALDAWALGTIRTLVADTLTPADPAPGRTVLFRVAAGAITGRTMTAGPPTLP